MLKMEQALITAGVDFEWHIYGENTSPYAQNILSKFSKAEYRGLVEIPPYIKYHYLVQLSDTEGFPYSIYESLSNLTPVIVTNFPSAHEMVQNGVNGYIVDFDLSNFDPRQLLQIPKIEKFHEQSTEKDWIAFLEA